MLSIKNDDIKERRERKVPAYTGTFLINMAATYSPALWCSTIGHEGLNFSVRNGKR
jgi:hypothetical protein